MKPLIIAVLVTAFICTALTPQRDRHYALPDDFDTVPQSIRAELEQRHCTIPQDPQTKELHNIVQGEFARQGQTDWAAYCSVDGQSQTVILWGGPAHCDGEPFGYDRPVADNALERDWDESQWGKMPAGGSYWKLSVVPRAEVNATQKREIASAPLRTSAKHDALQRKSPAGLNLVYCTSGKWQNLAYAD